MPRRTRKKIVDKIRKMTAEGYLPIEIKEKCKVSRPTVMKYSKGVQVTPPKEDIDKRQHELTDLRQRVAELESYKDSMEAIAKLPIQCSKGHPLVLALRCPHEECIEKGEYWGMLDGSDIKHPCRTGSLLLKQRKSLETLRAKIDKEKRRY